MWVEVVESMHQLLSDFAHFTFRQVPVVFQDFKELSLSELSDHAEFMGSLERIQKQNDVFIIQALQDLYLLSQIVQLFLCFASIYRNLG